KTHEQPRVVDEQPAMMRVPGNIQSDLNPIPAGPLAPSGDITPIPNLTFGAWSIVNSIDDAGTDFSGSTLKFISQREVAGGIEATGFFEWRNGDSVPGRETREHNFE